MVKESNALQFQLEILRLIPKRSYISSHEIQQKLEDMGFSRDIRSIQRQLKSLSEQFVNVIPSASLTVIAGKKMLKGSICRF